MSRIYIDTGILVYRIIGSAPVKKEYNQYLNKIKSRYSQRIIPQTVLGESLLKIIERSKNMDEDVRQFVSLVNELSNVKNQFPALSKEILVKSLELRDDTEYKIGYCDVVLIAHALCSCCDCDVFIVDTAVHQSEKIQDEISKCSFNVKLRDSIT